MGPSRTRPATVDPETHDRDHDHDHDHDRDHDHDHGERRRPRGPTPAEEALRALVATGYGTLPEEMEW
jgi:ABC-type Zn2+ transport system substrate-binding protein/surface adhesin